MPPIDVTVDCPVFDSFRVQQVAGMFDVPVAERASERFRVEVPELGDDWKIGLIVGPSGSGKSTIAKKMFGDRLYRQRDWPRDKAVIDGLGLEVIPVPFRDAYPFGGGLHCATADVYREGNCEDYFPKQIEWDDFYPAGYLKK